jgi:hypothetical protein
VEGRVGTLMVSPGDEGVGVDPSGRSTGRHSVEEIRT